MSNTTPQWKFLEQEPFSHDWFFGLSEVNPEDFWRIDEHFCCTESVPDQYMPKKLHRVIIETKTITAEAQNLGNAIYHQLYDGHSQIATFKKSLGMLDDVTGVVALSMPYHLIDHNILRDQFLNPMMMRKHPRPGEDLRKLYHIDGILCLSATRDSRTGKVVPRYKISLPFDDRVKTKQDLDILSDKIQELSLKDSRIMVPQWIEYPISSITLAPGAKHRR